MVDEATDRELVDALRSGSAAALGDLFDRHADRIYTYCFRRTASWATAEDATSTVFLEAWRSRGRATAHDDAALPWPGSPEGPIVRREDHHESPARR